MIEEIWKDIPDYEGYYQVSSLGRVKSLPRKKVLRERILKTALDGGGYQQVGLFLNAKRKIMKIHKLVAIAFLNHKPCGYKWVINHKNFIKTDNRLENLEIVTQRENANKKHLKSSSRYTGVCWVGCRKKWVSWIQANGKNKQLRYFTSEIEASEAYQKALSEILKKKQ